MENAFQCSAPSRVYSFFISSAFTFINTCPILYQLPPLSLVVESAMYRAGRANEQAASHRTPATRRERGRGCQGEGKERVREARVRKCGNGWNG